MVQTIYGAALCGVGIICLLGVRNPLRYAAIFLFMLVYKSIVFIALVPRLALMEDAPVAGWVIAAIWLCIAIVSAIAYPWGTQRQLLEARQGQEGA